MEATAEPSGSNEPLTLMGVLALLLESVEGSWMKSLIRSRRAAAVAARLARASARIAVLLERFKAGEVLWQPPRAKKVAEIVPEPDPAPEPGAVEAAEQAGPACEEPVPPRRKRPYRLPSLFGWLADTLPVTAIFHGAPLIEVMETPDMQALMLATPEVARLMRPIFRMLALEDDVLKVPVGYVEPAWIAASAVARARYASPDRGSGPLPDAGDVSPDTSHREKMAAAPA